MYLMEIVEETPDGTNNYSIACENWVQVVDETERFFLNSGVLVSMKITPT